MGSTNLIFISIILPRDSAVFSRAPPRRPSTANRRESSQTKPACRPGVLQASDLWRRALKLIVSQSYLALGSRDVYLPLRSDRNISFYYQQGKLRRSHHPRSWTCALNTSVKLSSRCSWARLLNPTSAHGSPDSLVRNHVRSDLRSRRSPWLGLDCTVSSAMLLRARGLGKHGFHGGSGSRRNWPSSRACKILLRI